MFEYFLALTFIAYFVGQLMMLATGPESDIQVRHKNDPDMMEPCYTKAQWLKKAA